MPPSSPSCGRGGPAEPLRRFAQRPPYKGHRRELPVPPRPPERVRVCSLLWAADSRFAFVRNNQRRRSHKQEAKGDKGEGRAESGAASLIPWGQLHVAARRSATCANGRNHPASRREPRKAVQLVAGSQKIGRIRWWKNRKEVFRCDEMLIGPAASKGDWPRRIDAYANASRQAG